MLNEDFVKEMTIEEKASLCSGKDFWHLDSVERLGLTSIMVTDGPHGLRKQVEGGDHLGINDSVPATCFPTACATASSWDKDLLHSIGEAIGEECLQEDVAVILGPGANIKRSPLCGRNFEYISEDPHVAGELSSALINGVQSKGIGTSLKHFAANNQETRRMTSNSVIDERALREIYLTGFETAVKSAQPWTVMCSYNLLNGTYASENDTLLNGILRDEWGFKGLVVTDWGAANGRVKGLVAGLDLQMPGPCAEDDAKITAAAKSGALETATLDKAVCRITDLITKSQANKKPGYSYDKAAHHALARKAAAESAVLLKNTDSILPLKAEQSIAIIGEFAKAPRYQGAGSSKINPTQLTNAYDAILSLGIHADYADGYSNKGTSVDGEKIAVACEVSKGKDAVIIFAGLPDDYESEGFDRSSIDMPESHNALIDAVSKVNENVIVVLMCGSAVAMPWAGKVKGILLLYLAGQAGGEACADLLYGKKNPSGKLAESFPLALEDCPAHNYFPGGSKSVEYRESIFVGYRYYDSAKKAVAFPFGFGLSYTNFTYSGLAIGKNELEAGGALEVTLTVKNTGSVAGAEVVQLYISDKTQAIYKAEKELKGFKKIFLEAGESKTVTFTLDRRSFSYYNAAIKDWAVSEGEYEIKLAASSRDIRLSQTIHLAGDGKETLLPSVPTYKNLPTGVFSISNKEFTAVYGRELPPSERLSGEDYTANSTLRDIQGTPVGDQIIGLITSQAGAMLGGGEDNDIAKMMAAMLMDMPVRSLGMMSGGAMGSEQINGMLAALNAK